MDNGLLWLVVLAAVIGAFIYFGTRASKQADQTRQERLSQIRIATDQLADLIAKGNQIRLIAGDTPNIALRDGEHVLCVFAGTTLLIPRAVRTWRSVYGGPTIRIAKGLSFRVGQSRGVSESHDELRPVDQGTLVLTNQRLTFTGLDRTSSVPLEKIIEVEGYSDGMRIHREDKDKVECYQLSDSMQMHFEYNGETKTMPVDGRVIKIAVDEAIGICRDKPSQAVVATAHGDALLAQGNLKDALETYREGLAIKERSAKADTGKTTSRHDLVLSQLKIGDVLKAQGNLADALKSYRDGFAIADSAVKADPGDTVAQFELATMYERIGDVLQEQGNLAEALKSYRNGFPIREKLAVPSDTNAQRQLSISYDSLGDVLSLQGNLEEALRLYRLSFVIRQRLVEADPGNTAGQRDLLVSRQKIGVVLRFQGNFEEALKEESDGLMLADRLAKDNPSNPAAQRDLFVSHDNLGDILKSQGNLGDALNHYRDGLVSVKRLADADPAKWRKELRYAAGKIGGLADKFLKVRNFQQAIDVADQAISVAPDLIWLYANRAHALMFLGQAEAARAIYVQYEGRQKVQGEKSWEDVVLNDFSELRKAGLTHPLMDEVTRLFDHSSGKAV